MISRVARFLSILHREHLKAAGYVKQGRDFLRTRPGYTEVFSISGVEHNSGDPQDPWGFYLHVQIAFANLPPPLLGFGKQRAHWAAHAEKVAGRELELFEILPGHNEAELSRDIAALMQQASEHVASNEKEIRATAIERNKDYARSHREWQKEHPNDKDSSEHQERLLSQWEAL